MQSIKISNRVHLLEALILFLEQMKTGIRYNSAQISRLVISISSREEFRALTFLSECSENLDRKIAFPKAWKQGVETAFKTGDIGEQEKDILISFGQGLGISDIEGQLSNCDVYIELISNMLLKARHEKESKGRLYTTLGLLSGLGTAILLA